MLITRKGISYWGNHRLDEINKRIKCQPATGTIGDVLRGLILTPPNPPWMFVSFGPSNSADQLSVTDDNRLLRFSGRTSLAGHIVSEVNRDQVIAMHKIGMTGAEWKRYLEAYAKDSIEGIAAMRPIRQKHPKLIDMGRFPAIDSPEHLALKVLLAK